jgi:outer membrane biosynthesis protein TonB
MEAELTEGRRRARWWGWICSSLLHGVIAVLLLYLLPFLMPGPPLPGEPETVEVDLPPGDLGRATGGPDVAKHPQARAPDQPTAEPRKPEPVPDTKPAPSRVKPDRSSDIRPQHRPRHPQPTPLTLAPRNGSALSTLTVNAGSGGNGSDGSFSVKDFLRAQIERHWNFDLGRVAAANLVVSLHLSLDPDGSVRAADVVPDPRFDTNPAYHAIADSARRAALVSSPLQLPAGTYESVRDVTLTFNPHEAMQ